MAPLWPRDLAQLWPPQRVSASYILKKQGKIIILVLGQLPYFGRRHEKNFVFKKIGNEKGGSRENLNYYQFTTSALASSFPMSRDSVAREQRMCERSESATGSGSNSGDGDHRSESSATWKRGQVHVRRPRVEVSRAQALSKRSTKVFGLRLVEKSGFFLIFA